MTLARTGWRKQSMQEVIEKQAIKRAKKRQGEWAQVILHYLGAICVYCQAENINLNIHHIIPVSRGGKNEMSNLEVVCVPCHKKIHKAWELIPKKPVVVTRDCIKCKTTFETASYRKRLKCFYCKPFQKQNKLT